MKKSIEQDVVLEVRPGATRSRKWAHAETRNSRQVYRFRFEPEYGYVRARIGPKRDIFVTLKGVEDVEIFDLRILCDPFDQLHAERLSPTEFDIHNANNRLQVAYYAILVRHGQDIVICDPMIGNDPKH
jgi:hypothetical protein